MRDEAEYEDLLANWSDLELGLGVVLANPLTGRRVLADILHEQRALAATPPVAALLAELDASSAPAAPRRDP